MIKLALNLTEKKRSIMVSALFSVNQRCCRGVFFNTMSFSINPLIVAFGNGQPGRWAAEMARGAWNSRKKLLQPDSLYFFEHLLPFLLNQNILNGVELTPLPALFCPLPQPSKHVPYKMYFKVSTKLSTRAMGIIRDRESQDPQICHL